jgi:signal recognition particle subunit SRP54
MFENLGNKLQDIFDKLRQRGKLSDADVKAALREVRVALLEADVNFAVAKDFVARVQEKAVGQDVLNSLTPRLFTTNSARCWAEKPRNPC